MGQDAFLRRIGNLIGNPPGRCHAIEVADSTIGRRFTYNLPHIKKEKAARELVLYAAGFLKGMHGQKRPGKDASRVHGTIERTTGMLGVRSATGCS